jgi:hypothetical protein
LDEGRGLPDVDAAYRWLVAGGATPSVEVRVPASGTNAAWISAPPSGKRSGAVEFELVTPSGTPAATYSLRSDAAWLTAPASVGMAAETTAVELRYAGERLAAPGAHTAVVTGWPADTMAGPAFRLVTTVVVPTPTADTALVLRRDAAVAPGEVLRSFFRADSARPFQVRAAAMAGQRGLAHLHEPGGAPFREVSARPLGAGPEAALYRVDARDAQAGDYQLAAVAAPGERVHATVTVLHAPVTVRTRTEAGEAVASLENVSARTVQSAVELRLRGGQRVDTVRARGPAIQTLEFAIPRWASGLEVDVSMEREQWGRFTDFGVTVLDSAGGQIAQDPLEYAFGRLSTILPDGHGDIRGRLDLYPGFADASDEGEWSVVTTVRLYADSAVAVAPSEGAGALALKPKARGAVRFRLPDDPWPLPPGFVPLGVVLVRENEQVWTRESGFARSGS